MILIGMYDSPFVRRVALALKIYGMPYEHQPWSVFRDAGEVAKFNPLIRVPTLILDDGETLYDSTIILDALDDMVGPGRALMPAEGPERRRHQRICALATGMGDKVISLIYERAVHGRETPEWVARCTTQIAGALDALEADRAGQTTHYWFSAAISHADIAVACVLTLAVEALSFHLDPQRWPHLNAHRTQCETRPDFRRTTQPFFAPPPKP